MRLFRQEQRSSFFGSPSYNPFDNPSLPLASVGFDSVYGLLNRAGNASGEAITADKAMAIPTVWRCVGLLATVVAGCPLLTYKDPKKTLVHVPVLDPLNQDTTYTPFELWQLVVAHRALWGNSYVWKVRNKADAIVDLKPIYPGLVEVKRDKSYHNGKRFDVHIVDDNGNITKETEPFSDYEIMHFPGIGYDGLRGLSPLAIAAQTYGTAIAADKLAARYFANGTHLSGIINIKVPLSDQEQADAIKRRWRATNAGISHGGDIAILDAESSFQPLTIPPGDLQFLESREWEVSELARLYGIPPHMLGDETKATSWGCLPGSSLISTPSGPVRIDHLTPGDQVWSFSDTNGIEARPVTAWQMTGYKPLRTFRLWSRDLRVTSGHHMVIRRYVGRKDGARRGETGWQTMHVSASEVRPGDQLILPRYLPDGERTTTPNGAPLTAGLMELLGLYTGDGWLEKTGRVRIAHGTSPQDTDHIPHYRQLVQDELGVSFGTDKRGNCSGFSSQVFNSVLNQGFLGKAHTKRVPGWVFGLAEDLRLAYLRGYLDSDGGVNKSGGIGYVSVNRELLEDVRHLAMSAGIPAGRVRNRHDAGQRKIRGQECQSSDRYVLALNTVTENIRIGSNCPHKHNRLLNRTHGCKLKYDRDYKGPIMSEDLAAHPNRGIMRDLPKDVVVEKVLSVTEGNVCVPVYDITVEDNHTFIADAVIVGNSGLESLNRGFVAYTMAEYFIPIQQRVTREVVSTRNQYAAFDMTELMRGSTADRFAAYGQAIQWGWMMRNEARVKEDMVPLPGLDEPLLPLNMTTPTLAAQQAPNPEPVSGPSQPDEETQS